MEGRPIAAAEGALAADPAFEPGRALRALFADGLVTAVTSAQRGDTW